MPPHLHPRSRSTTSLFAATLLASFFIVGVPHVFPCPAPRRALADSQTILSEDGQQKIIRKRRRKVYEDQGQASAASPTECAAAQELNEEAAKFRQMEEEAKAMAKVGRECPVPKPGGLVGEILGFRNRNESRGRDGVPRADIYSR
ncbi:hypothetical protein AJ80_01394 [Polytolypa hystricis UAMH7299]|uniref:Alpha-1,3-mannosyltransferase n=1 Tax=Polytolypa hystricis (strain UAMH7299) TaxID=1447883 RepID=A0A2B7Z0R2_POLH7|nr:hypothetical protein AJ80_01394 [Polytolypa hystricis UAMH7299]